MSDPKLDHDDDEVQYLFAPCIGLSEALSRMCFVFSKAWALFLVFNIAARIVLFLFMFLGMMFLIGSQGSPSFAFVVVVEVVLSVLGGCIMDGANIHIVSMVYAGSVQSSTIWERLRRCFGAACSRCCTLLGSCMLFLLMVIVPSLVIAVLLENSLVMAVLLIGFCVVLPLVLLTYVMYPIIMVENTSAVSAITKSFAMVSRRFCFVLCSLFVWGCFKLVINVIVSSLSYNNGMYVEDAPYYGSSLFSSVGDGGHRSLEDYYLQYSQYSNTDDVYNQGNQAYYDDAVSETWANDSSSNSYNSNSGVKFDFNVGGPGDGLLSGVVGLFLSIFDAM